MPVGLGWKVPSLIGVWLPCGLAGVLVATGLLACSDDTSSTDSSSTTGSGGGGGAGGSGGAGGGSLAASISFVDLGGPLDLTPDGSVALIEDVASATVDIYFYETATGVLTKKTGAGDPSADLATGISGTLRVTAIHGVPAEAGIFSEASGWMDIPNPFPVGCDPNEGGAWDVSADGKIVVGFAWNNCSPQAFRWTDDGGAGQLALLDLLGAPAEGSTPPSNRATVVSDDGTVAAGFAQTALCDRFPAIWNADGTGFLLDDLALDTPGEVLSISVDGSTVAGITGWDGFRWTAATGSVVLPRLPTALPTDPMFPNAMTGSGDIVFGGSGDAFSGIAVAFVWTSKDGIRPLQDIAEANGVVVPSGVVLSNVLAASVDGSVLLGSTFDPNTNATKSFILHLPVSAYGAEP